MAKDNFKGNIQKLHTDLTDLDYEATYRVES